MFFFAIMLRGVKYGGAGLPTFSSAFSLQPELSLHYLLVSKESVGNDSSFSVLYIKRNIETILPSLLLRYE